MNWLAQLLHGPKLCNMQWRLAKFSITNTGWQNPKPKTTEHTYSHIYGAYNLLRPITAYSVLSD